MMKLFDRWEISVKVNDPGLKDYITLKPVIVPKTNGRMAKIRFWKSKYSIFERFINRLQVPGHKGKKHKLTSGHCTGKYDNCFLILEKTFEIIEKKTNKNPIEIFVKALENAAPREEITTIEYGGARYPQSVDCSPQRRIDIVLTQMTQGAYAKTFNTKKKITESLADEIIAAYNSDNSSVAIAKKLELERQAESSR